MYQASTLENRSSCFRPSHNPAHLQRLPRILQFRWKCIRPQCYKPGLQVSGQVITLLTKRDYLEYCNFSCSKFRYDTFQVANNKGVDRTAQMHMLVCVVIVREPQGQVLSRQGPDKSGFLKIIFIIAQLKHVVDLKRTVSMRWFYLALKTHV